MGKEPLRRFLIPVFSRTFLIRLLLVAFSAYLVFGHLCVPIFIRGKSMEPTYSDGSFNFCWKMKYWFRKPKRSDVVILRLAGERMMLLKRVVALAGDEVEFRNGNLFVNGREVKEPYVANQGNWNLPPRRVENDAVYVVGDNRAVEIERHHFGQAPLGRVIGGPLW